MCYPGQHIAFVYCLWCVPTQTIPCKHRDRGTAIRLFGVTGFVSPRHGSRERDARGLHANSSRLLHWLSPPLFTQLETRVTCREHTKNIHRPGCSRNCTFRAYVYIGINKKEIHQPLLIKVCLARWSQMKFRREVRVCVFMCVCLRHRWMFVGLCAAGVYRDAGICPTKWSRSKQNQNNGRKDVEEG